MTIDMSCWCESSTQECASPDCKNRPQPEGRIPMHTNNDARTAVIAAIEAGDASRNDFDIDAIVSGIYDATGDYDIEAMDHGAFWDLVAANQRTA